MPPTSSTFWLEEGVDANGQPFRQLQYTQRVLLKFNGLNWPHVTVGTLRLQYRRERDAVPAARAAAGPTH